MDVRKEHIARIQAIMKFLGFYNGTVDGIWGRSSMAAKQRWEMSESYEPAYPSQGRPLDVLDKKLPKGVMRDTKNRTLLTHIKMTDEQMESLLANEPKRRVQKPLEPSVKSEPVPENTATVKTEQVEQTEKPANKPVPEGMQRLHPKKKKHR